MKNVDELIKEGLEYVHKGATKAAYTMSIDYDEAYSVGCMALVRAAPKYRGTSSFKSFMYRVLHNEYLICLRDRRRPINKVLFDASDIYDVANDDVNVEDDYSNKDIYKKVVNEAEHLGGYIATIITKMQEGFSRKTACRLVGIDTTTGWRAMRDFKKHCIAKGLWEK